ncbi:prepilin-type N-terminal cleavage/methylation domain-containing protein [Aquibacillus sp. 3ASR75-11]|uniref:ComG operon protein 3 n=1 Tax=Terrihalobacillus insolitus TaxID=2950438 RepID=A0A9X3WVI1_9BACI|nr:competence type IV pilus major pilin ComGC [Terrihalobacillus insolitus]MDC3413403.1 prepilin-type N-terminal cleavage/methylation domain-containing protein [Terrihalobacillus insolitus]MDC3424986.1 prepilin-type N-terminal cleavage/methylation domain-containing protein [Terrihalobacillus insolitus]
MLKNEKGFTLIEMLIVLMIISILLILIIPNLAEKNTSVQNTGCDALVQMANGQVQAYQMDNGSLPIDMNALVTENYLSKTTCENGKTLTLTTDGKVIAQ